MNVSYFLVVPRPTFFSPPADFALSFLTACSHMRRQRAALAHLQRLPHDGDGDGGGSGPEPSWSILTGDMTAPLPLRTRIPRLERTLLVSQLLAWNLACVGSLVVCAVFWTALVSKNYSLLDEIRPLPPLFFSVGYLGPRRQYERLLPRMCVTEVLQSVPHHFLCCRKTTISCWRGTLFAVCPINYFCANAPCLLSARYLHCLSTTGRRSRRWTLTHTDSLR